MTNQEIDQRLEELRNKYIVSDSIMRKIIVIQANLLKAALKKRGAYQLSLDK